MIEKYYKILEFQLDSVLTEELIKSQYRKVVKKYHPDTCAEEYKDGKDFLLLKEAYDFLLQNFESLNLVMRIKDETDRTICLEMFDFLKKFLSTLENEQKEEVQKKYSRIYKLSQEIYKFKSESILISFIYAIKTFVSANVDPIVISGCLLNLSLAYLKQLDLSKCRIKLIYSLIKNADLKTKILSDEETAFYTIYMTSFAIFNMTINLAINYDSINVLEKQLETIFESDLFSSYHSSLHYIQYMAQKIRERIKNG